MIMKDGGVDGSDGIAGDGRLWRCCFNPGSKSKGVQEAGGQGQQTNIKSLCFSVDLALSDCRRLLNTIYYCVEMFFIY
jgi:hypothetical protein